MVDEIRNDKDVSIAIAKSQELVSKVDSLVIRDEPSSKLGSDMLSLIKLKIKKLEEARKRFVKPLQDHVKDINDEFKEYIQPFQQMEQILKDKLIKYNDFLEKKAQDEAKAKKVDADNLAKDLNIPAPEVAPVPVNNQTKGSLGMSYIQKRWTFTVVDFSKVPDEYKEINSAKVRTAISEGAREISGISIFQEKTVGNR